MLIWCVKSNRVPLNSHIPYWEVELDAISQAATKCHQMHYSKCLFDLFDVASISCSLYCVFALLYLFNCRSLSTQATIESHTRREQNERVKCIKVDDKRWNGSLTTANTFNKRANVELKSEMKCRKEVIIVVTFFVAIRSHNFHHTHSLGCIAINVNVTRTVKLIP